MNKATVLRGIIIPDNWDEHDNVTAIAISAVGEKEYPIEMNGMGKNLLKHISHEVCLEGHVCRNLDLDREFIRVQLYQLLDRKCNHRS